MEPGGEVADGRCLLGEQQVAGQLTAGRGGQQGHHGRGDVLVLLQEALDLLQIDPVPPDLDLAVRAAEVLDLPVREEPPEVAGAVEPAGWGSGRVGDEALRGEVVAVDVAAGDAGAPDADLAHLAGRNRAEVLVEQHDRGRGEWPADRDGAPLGEFGHRAGDRGLRRAVGVEDPATAPAPALDQFGGAGLAPDVDRADRRDRAIERGEDGGNAVEHRDRRVLEEVRKRRADVPSVRRSGHEGRTPRPGRPDLLDREIEGDRHALVDALGVGDAVQLGDHAEQAADARVGYRDALRAPGRTRGVDDVAQRILVQPQGRAAGWCRSDVIGDTVEFDVGDREPVEGAGERRGGEDRVELRVLRDERQAVTRHRGVDRHERRAGLGHREQRGVHRHRPLQEEPDPAADRHPTGEQVVRQAVRPLVELGVGQLLALALERDGGRPAIDRSFEELVQTTEPRTDGAVRGGWTGRGRDRRCMREPCHECVP